MMNYIETIGNIKVYEEHNSERDITITFINGSDIVAQEVYFTNRTDKAIADLFMKKFDTYTEAWLWLNYITDGLVKLSSNTYRINDKDYFCRIDNTRYFKRFHKSADEFIKDKNGERIIDR